MFVHAVPPVAPPVVLRAFAPAPQNWLPAHRGVDLAAAENTPVVSVRAGTVVVSKVIADRPVLVVRSGRVRFTFEPVIGSRPIGSRVRSGERIGVTGSGGHCAHVCLHWGAKIAGDYVDPLSFLPSSTPVLKPVRTARSVASARASPAAPCCESGSRGSP